MAIELVKKYKVALFIKDEDKSTWVRVQKSTAFDLTLNPTTETRDYIVDQHPTTEITDYVPSLNQAITMYKGNSDYDLLFPLAYDLPTGEDAKVPVLIVFSHETVDDSTTQYKAWNCPSATLSFTNINTVESTLTFDINFGGTIQKGYATADSSTGQPSFTKSEDSNGDWEDPFEGTIDSDSSDSETATDSTQDSET